MARLIDAVRLQGEMMEMIHEGYGLEDMVDAVIEAPTVDAVAVVRCKDCGYSYDSVGGLCCSHGVCVDCVVPEDFFCRYGKCKGGDE